MQVNIQILKKISVFLFFIMFIYSGINKIFSFNKKILTLQNKINLPYYICAIGMVLVILLEIVGSLIIYYYIFHNYNIKYITNLIYILFLLFLIVVTYIYHPPTDKIIPFLSNVTTFSGLLYLYADYLHNV